jgi:hypothetical protein
MSSFQSKPKSTPRNLRVDTQHAAIDEDAKSYDSRDSKIQSLKRQTRMELNNKLTKNILQFGQQSVPLAKASELASYFDAKQKGSFDFMAELTGKKGSLPVLNLSKYDKLSPIYPKKLSTQHNFYDGKTKSFTKHTYVEINSKKSESRSRLVGKHR